MGTEGRSEVGTEGRSEVGTEGNIKMLCSEQLNVDNLQP